MFRIILAIVILMITLIVASVCLGHSNSENDRHNENHSGFNGSITHAHSEGIAGEPTGPFHTHEGAYKFTDDNHTQDLSSSYLSDHDVNNPDNFTDRGDKYFDHNRHTTTETDGIVTPNARETQTGGAITTSSNQVNAVTPGVYAETGVEPETNLRTPQAWISAPNPLPDMRITHINLRHKPYTLFVYVRNASGEFVGSITLEIRNADGTVALRHSLNGLYQHFTPQTVNTRKHTDYLSLGGVAANNLIAIAANHIMKSWDYRKETARLRIAVRQFRSRGVWKEDSVIRLLSDGEVVAEYPMPEVASAPRLQRKLATSWAEIKNTKILWGGVRFAM